MRAVRRSEASGFDAWLRTSLHQQNDDTLRDAVPDELVRLVDQSTWAQKQE